ncbi:uncharacterized protein LOC103713352 isoform X2 [Phoenix dactylifera]|uniref:Uncharacterized protein LOC103713352 isoform X2 n=1 Tax=Phoenix dactylifera TaxID=42345 RepID=A0A8B8ZA60_PHODC|nr:uncharacterized protein LOC103713352 isoform X2 [Phoenix dactylifera]
MCSSRIKSGHAVGLEAVAQIDGRAVLQPACNRIATLEACRPLKKTLQKSVSLPTSFPITSANSDFDADETKLVASSPKPPKFSPPVSPKAKPANVVLKRGNDPNGLNSSGEKPATPKASTKPTPVVRKKSKKTSSAGQGGPPVESSLFSSCDRAPGSIAAAQREQASLIQAQRKMRIAHYGRTASKLEGKVVPVDSSSSASLEEKRCSFITSYSAYHDEEWGVPVHDDKMLFELLVLSGAQVGLDWTTILRKRNDFRAAFAEFDAEVVSKFTERQMSSISSEYGLDLGRVRGTVDNASRILEVRKEFGSLDKYLWGFVNSKPISTNYKTCRKIPVKTSKSESISKDMVRRGFRFVGPTVVHSFMQAAGLTNDHLITCPRHLYCSSIAAAAAAAAH